MDPKTPGKVIPGSTGLAAMVPRAKVNKPAGKPAGKPTGKPAIKPAGSRKSTDTGGTRSKMGKPDAKKRRKLPRAASLGPIHPSVVVAEAWTSRQEQMEEVRARESVYAIPKTTAGASLEVAATGDAEAQRRSSVGRTAVAGEVWRARRPWEWSAKDCEAVLADARSRADSAMRSFSSEGLTAGSQDESTAAEDCADVLDHGQESVNCHGNNGEWVYPRSTEACDEDNAAKSAEELSSPRGATARFNNPATTGRNGTKERQVEPLCSNKRPPGTDDVDNGVTIPCDAAQSFYLSDKDSRAATAGEHKKPRLKACIPARVPSPAVLPDVSASHKKPRLKARIPARVFLPAMLPPDTSAADSSGDVCKDERKARELSAALNRNCPRGQRTSKSAHGKVAPEAARGPGQRRGGSTHCKSSNDYLGAKKLSAELNRNSARPGRRSSLDKIVPEETKVEAKSQGEGRTASCVIQERQGSSGDADSSTHVAVGSSNGARLGAQGYLPWRGRGFDFVEGTRVEVRWDDQRWYRCTLSSISSEGKYGVLEFLPYRRRTQARNFSTELELDEWIDAGHLVRPGTHLEWD